MALLDSEMRYIAWSPRWLEHHGVEGEESLRGANHYDVFPELDDGWKAIHSHCLRGHSEQGDVEPLKRTDGSTQWIRNIIRPWYKDAEETRVGGLVLFTEDLTRQIESQRQFAQQKSLLKTVVDDAPAVVFAFNASGTVTLSIGRGLAGLGPDALGTSLVRDYSHIEGLAAAIQTVLDGEPASWQSESDGHYFETSAVPTLDEGIVTGGLAVAVDVTERILEQRQARLKAEGLPHVLSATSKPGSFQMQMHALLVEVAGYLGLDSGVLARSVGEAMTCVMSASTEGGGIPPGSEWPRAGTYDDLVLTRDGVLAIDDVDVSDPEVHAAHEVEAFKVYIGAHVFVEGQPYGTLSFRSAHLASRPFEASDRALVQLAAQWAGGLVEREQRAQETSTQAARLRAMADQFAVRDGSVADNARAVLHLLCTQIGTDVGLFSRVKADQYEVVVASLPETITVELGRSVPLGDTYCSLTLDTADVLTIDEVLRPPEKTHPLHSTFTPSAFIGAPVLVGGAAYGMIDLSSLQPRGDVFTEADRDLVRLVAGWIGGMVERSQQGVASRSLLDAMSHEIRTPLNTVLGFGDLLETTELDHVQREYVGTIQRASQRMLGLIDVLDFSKMEADPHEVQNPPFFIAQMAESVLEQFAPQAVRKGVELTLALEESGTPMLPTRVVGDEKRMHQVLSNLVSNAIKFTEAGSVELVIRARGRLGSDPEDTLQIEFDVIDTGIGIPENRLADVFEPFVQADAETTRQYGGTGLGLAISRQLVERMGGVIEAESQVGEGSRFRVRIPVQKTDTVRRQVIRPKWTALSGLRVLLVDDNADELRITSDQCRAWGMAVHATSDPAEALAWLDADEGFELAILDMQMPVMNWTSLATAIRERQTVEELPIVILSWEARGRHVPGLVQAILQKPVFSATLHALLLRVVGAPVTGSIPEDQRIQQARKVAEITKERSQLRILVAEDEPDNQTLTLHMLRTLGYEADIASNGTEALTKMRSGAYDLVFMDIMMPQMDGLEVTRRLRSESLGNAQPRVVALTARALRSDREACLQAGMDDYLAKPVRIGDLARALDAVVAV